MLLKLQKFSQAYTPNPIGREGCRDGHEMDGLKEG
jgi:hypothetical protein